MLINDEISVVAKGSKTDKKKRVNVHWLPKKGKGGKGIKKGGEAPLPLH